MAITQARRRTRYTTAQRRDLLGQYRRSGLSARVFAREQGLPLSTLYQWIHRMRPTPERSLPVFQEVSLRGLPLLPPWAAELAIGSELTLRLGPQLSPGFIAQLIQQLRRPC